MVCSIIIATRNRADSLRQTLESLDSVDVPVGLQPEILIVDNGSTDHTAEVARSPLPGGIPIRYLSEPGAGKTKALNTALSGSKADICLFTDDDLRFPPDWLENMCAPIVEKKADALAGNVELAPHLQRPWMTLTHRGWLASTERLDPVEPTDMVGANMAFARSVLNLVPTFDLELGPGALGYCDDVLFTFQLKKAGLKVRRGSGPPLLHYFDESRLTRIHWLRAAKNLAKSLAYVDYHWRHRNLSHAVIVRRLARRGMIYYVNRILKWRECQSREGAAEWEISQVHYIHYLIRYAVESKRPRNYDLEGLVKIRGVVEPPNPARTLARTLTS